jgi:hypothetical protein
MGMMKTAAIEAFNAIKDIFGDAVISVAYRGEYRENSAVRSTHAEAQILSLNGEDSEYQFSIRIPCGLFADEPVAGETMTVKGIDDNTDGTQYSILTYIPDSLGAIARVDLGNVYA